MQSEPQMLLQLSRGLSRFATALLTFVAIGARPRGAGPGSRHRRGVERMGWRSSQWRRRERARHDARDADRCERALRIEERSPGDQALRFSKSGFASALVTDARVLIGQSTTVNGNLRPEFYEMEEFEVTAEEFTEQTEKILIERQKSSSMVEALGSDFLSKVGAGNAAESISKVSGATIVDGKFAVIRGLSDRYVSTTLNGANIPSADPYRQSASLDLFRPR